MTRAYINMACHLKQCFKIFFSKQFDSLGLFCLGSLTNKENVFSLEEKVTQFVRACCCPSRGSDFGHFKWPYRPHLGNSMP